jgi:hypothetical protein
MKKNKSVHIFEGWFTIVLPDTWKYENDDAVLNISSCKNPKGVIQISFFYNEETDEHLIETARRHLNRFIEQFKLIIDENSYKFIEAPNFTIANVSGISDEEFIKVWILVNNNKMLLISYISPQKTRELSIAEDIVYSINFI